MKYGIEVEGRLKGVKTLFLDAHECTEKALRFLKFDERGQGIGHIYISDPSNTISYNHICTEFKMYHVTLDVTSVRQRYGLDNLSIMFRIDKCPQDQLFDSIYSLRSDLDQVKVEKDRHVFVFPASSYLETFPEEFEGDIEI